MGEKGFLTSDSQGKQLTQTHSEGRSSGSVRCFSSSDNVEAKFSGAGGHIQLPTHECAPGSCPPRESVGPEAAWV